MSHEKKSLWYIPFVFTGTNTRFGNFIPAKSKNPSDRGGFGPKDETTGGTALFDPFVLLASFDAYAKMFNFVPKLGANMMEYIKSFNYPYHLTNFGRPMWGGILSSVLKAELGNEFIENSRNGPCIPRRGEGSFTGALDTIQALAIKKIFYGPKNTDVTDRVESAVAILHIITGSGCIYGPVASSLVEKRMGCLLDYRYDTSQLRVIYPSEPALAVAALTQFHNYPASIIDDALLSYDCLTGSLGEIGEFGARIIFLLALDSITLQRPFCTVNSFLRNLIGESVDGLESLAINNPRLRSILKGCVSFSHFTKALKLCDTPLANLGLSVTLNAALSMPQNFQGVDNVIPVVLENGGLGSINVQVKSHARKMYPHEIGSIKTSIIGSGFCTSEYPSLNIIINVGPKHEYSCELHKPTPKSHGAYSIVIHGIAGDFPLFKKFTDVQQKLEQLLGFGRFDVDLRKNKANLLSLSADWPVCGSRTCGNWKDIVAVKENKPKASTTRVSKPRTSKRRKSGR